MRIKPGPLTLAHSPAQIVAQWLRETDLQILVDPDHYINIPYTADLWPVYYDYMPWGVGVPQTIIGCYNTQGLPDGRDHATGQQFDHPGVQVRLRGPDSLWAMTETIKTLLEGLFRVEVVLRLDDIPHCYRLQCFTRSSPPVSLGSDDNKMENTAINGTVAVSRIN